MDNPIVYNFNSSRDLEEQVQEREYICAYAAIHSGKTIEECEEMDDFSLSELIFNEVNNG